MPGPGRNFHQGPKADPLAIVSMERNLQVRNLLVTRYDECGSLEQPAVSAVKSIQPHNNQFNLCPEDGYNFCLNRMKKKQGNENILLPDRVMKLSAPRAFALMAFMALLTCGLVRPASADIYWFTDETGVVHFSNVPTDKRYVPFTAANDTVVKKTIAGTRDRRADTPAKAQYSAIIEEIARIYALESALIHAVVSAESAYNATALSKKGAAGLMQLMPDTARRYGVTDRFDPKQNLHAGAKYLTDLLKMFNGNVSLALAAYNAGENSVVKYGNQIPPFQETRNYVPRVLDLYQKYQVSMKLVQPQRGT